VRERNDFSGRRAILRSVLAFVMLTIAPLLSHGVAAAPGDRLVAIYQARPAGDQAVTSDGLAALQQAIQQRLAAYGITDANVQVQGSDQIVVEIPDTRDAQQIVTRIVLVGLCEFVGSDAQLAMGSAITTSLGGPIAAAPNADGTPPDAAAATTTTADDTVYPTLLQSTDIADAMVADYTVGPVPTITFTLRDTVTQAFGDYTEAHIGQYVSILVDKRVVSSAILRDRINGTATIAGLDLDNMRALAAFLYSGPLIMPIALIDTHITPATA
jgi:preprotein translocase subunit SecD